MDKFTFIKKINGMYELNDRDYKKIIDNHDGDNHSIMYDHHGDEILYFRSYDSYPNIIFCDCYREKVSRPFDINQNNFIRKSEVNSAKKSFEFNVDAIRNNTKVSKIEIKKQREEKLTLFLNEKFLNFIKHEIIDASSKGRFECQIHIASLIPDYKDEDFDFLFNKIKEEFKGFDVSYNDKIMKGNIYITWWEE